MTPAQRAKMEELALKFWDDMGFKSTNGLSLPDSYKAGFTAALEMQSAEVPEFDEMAAHLAAMEHSHEEMPKSNASFRKGARWQHSQDDLKLAQLQQEVERVKQQNKELAEQALNSATESLLVGFGREQAAIWKDSIEKPLLEKLAQLQQEIVQLKQNILAYKMREWSDEDTKEELAASQAEVERLKTEHEKFCSEAQEKTDADFAVVREAAEKARAELAASQAEVERLKRELAMAYDVGNKYSKIIADQETKLLGSQEQVRVLGEAMYDVRSELSTKKPDTDWCIQKICEALAQTDESKHG